MTCLDPCPLGKKAMKVTCPIFLSTQLGDGAEIGSPFFSTTTIRCTLLGNVFTNLYFNLTQTVRALFHCESHGKLLPLYSHQLLRCCDSNSMDRNGNQYLWYKVVSIQIWYKLKQWNCTTISITSSIVCVWTRITFRLNISHSSFFKPSIKLFSPWLTQLVSKWPITIEKRHTTRDSHSAVLLIMFT